ncbi:hypothetical protein Tam1G_1186 [Bifidobacterium imperatoris]|uniref:Uncharacterized protein n=1 Tax=Bifidobacterium imperatoris TaxID=2020965 RepID=A0A2N5IS25_9BIFI|nr:hypothetical protein Tam1G_1186 [Bifidobacterium imperatoris]
MASWNEGGASPNQLRAFQGRDIPFSPAPFFFYSRPHPSRYGNGAFAPSTPNQPNRYDGGR